MAEDMENGGAPESVQSEQDAGKETGSTLMTETGNESAKEQEAVGAPQNSGEEPKAEPEKAEPYTLTAPEGYPISEKELSDFNRHCLEVGMTKEQAEKSLEMLHLRRRRRLLRLRGGIGSLRLSLTRNLAAKSFRLPWLMRKGLWLSLMLMGLCGLCLMRPDTEIIPP